MPDTPAVTPPTAVAPPATTADPRAPDPAAQGPTRLVFVGDVDHDQSGVIGQLLHDFGRQPAGRAAATIDGAGLRFALDGRAYVIVDAPGHRQFLANLVTGAADADAAVLVVDAAEGVREPIRRHAGLLGLIGIGRVIVVLNQADTLGFDQARLAAVAASVTAALARLDIVPLAVVPAAVRDGDNIALASARMPWHAGPTLAQALRALPPPAAQAAEGFRLPVQDVRRDGAERLVVGRIERGCLAVGDAVAIGAHGATARVARFVARQAAEPARTGQSVAIVLEPDVVVERGDLLYPPDDPPLRSARLRSRLFWLRADPLRVGESFSLRLATAEYPVTVASIDFLRPIGGAAPMPADEVPAEGIAEVTLHAPQEVLFDAFVPGRAGGRGVLADGWQRIVGAAPLLGPATHAAATQVFPPDRGVTLRDRAEANGHYGAVFWMTGLPGSGKSTIARLAEALLFGRGLQVAVLDGDTLRARLNSDLGFAEADRTENIRRTAAVARLMADHGLVVLTSLISPTAAQRRLAHATVGEGFFEVFVRADLATCEARDPKGLYAAARAGKLPGFTGIGAPYEAPEAADIVLDTTQQPAEASAAQLAALIEQRVRLPGRGRG